MNLYYVHFASQPDEPIPAVSELKSIEAPDPLSAAQALLRRRETQGVVRWARVGRQSHPCGPFRQELVVPVSDGQVPELWDDDFKRTNTFWNEYTLVWQRSREA